MAKKKRLFRDFDVQRIYNQTVTLLRNKYYNLFRAQFKWNGLNYRQEDYIMRKFWQEGTVAAFKIQPKGLDTIDLKEIGFAPWTLQTYDMYMLPETILLINESGSQLIPTKPLIVDKETCIGYIQHNKKSVFMTVDWYVKRMAQVDMVINTNLHLHKMPFLLNVDNEEQDKVDDIVTRILNNEIVVVANGIDLKAIQAVATSAPYIIDKLVQYKTTLENELKTYLSINNSGSIQKAEQLQLSEVNSNNDEIMDSEQTFLKMLGDWCKNIKTVLGVDISVESTSKPIEVMGQVHDNEFKTGPKEGEDDDE